MGPVAGVVGVAVIGVALWDTFETVVLPRRVTRRLRPARLLFKSLWKLWLLVAAVIRRPGRRESFLSLFGPFSLIVLLGGWSMMLLLGFALVHSALGLQIAVSECMGRLQEGDKQEKHTKAHNDTTDPQQS